MLEQGKVAMGEPINVVVPTGNFGNILAAYYARAMGTPIAKLICASNRNRVLTDFFESGTYNTARPFYTTTSPSMDILVSSNLERLLYHLAGEDSALIADMMGKLREDKQYTVPATVREQMDKLFAAGCASDEEVAATIKAIFDKTGYLLDTHTAVAFHVYDAYRAKTGDGTPTVIASTANPYKFTPAILSALERETTGTPFELMAALQLCTKAPIPAPLGGLNDKAVRFTDTCEGDTDSMRQTVCRMLHLD
jgi:threonine synthase